MASRYTRDVPGSALSSQFRWQIRTPSRHLTAEARIFFFNDTATTEIYTDDAAFAAHSASEVHAAAAPVFTELIAGSDVIIGETLMAKGLGG